jgi:hypothetical protein
MRTLVGSFLVVTASVCLSPGSQDFHNRYGEPDENVLLRDLGSVLPWSTVLTIWPAKP